MLLDSGTCRGRETGSIASLAGAYAAASGFGALSEMPAGLPKAALGLTAGLGYRKAYPSGQNWLDPAEARIDLLGRKVAPLLAPLRYCGITSIAETVA